MRGYLDEPEQTAATVDADGWLHTGDVGVMDDRGYLRITDRTKDMFIVGGFNVSGEIENLFLRNEKIAQVAVVGVPTHGEVGMAFVVLPPPRRTRTRWQWDGVVLPWPTRPGWPHRVGPRQDGQLQGAAARRSGRRRCR